MERDGKVAAEGEGSNQATVQIMFDEKFPLENLGELESWVL